MINWQKLQSEDRDSTIAWFQGGWTSDQGFEVLVWKGVEDEGEFYLTSHNGNEVPEWAKYIVEVKNGDKVFKESFAKDKGEAFNRARQEVVFFDANEAK